MTPTAVGRPAWFGKLPALGDFASRRMPPEVLHAWDEWLAGGLAAWSARDPRGWLGTYLGAASRRFVFVGTGGGVPDAFAIAAAWAGVLMPSVDRVGRYFPFTLLQPLARVPVEPAEARGLLVWLHRADELAADAMHDEWTVEALETALDALAAEAPGWFGSARPAADSPRRWLLRSASAAYFGVERRVRRVGAATDRADAGDETVFLASPEDDPGTELAEALRRATSSSSSPSADAEAGTVWWFGRDAAGVPDRLATRGLPRGAGFAELYTARPASGR